MGRHLQPHPALQAMQPAPRWQGQLLSWPRMQAYTTSALQQADADGMAVHVCRMLLHTTQAPVSTATAIKPGRRGFADAPWPAQPWPLLSSTRP